MQHILEGNEAWRRRIWDADPDYFPRLAAQQAPDYFWIGCSDSRVPANVVAGLDPGEVFVHRNVANVVHSADMNMLATLEYAVHVLKVRKVVVTGHYGCGGVTAAMGELTHSLADHWLEPIRRVAAANAAELDRLEDGAARIDRLCELNVLEGVRRVSDTPILREAWRAGRELSVHGLIYGLRDGRLRDLGCTLTAADAS
jgi:carbonic anhydrase